MEWLVLRILIEGYAVSKNADNAVRRQQPINTDFPLSGFKRVGSIYRYSRTALSPENVVVFIVVLVVV